MTTATSSVYALSAEEQAFYEREGYLIVRGLFDPAELRELRDFFDGLAAKGEPIANHWWPSEEDPSKPNPLAKYPRVMMPHRFHAKSKEVLLDPRVRDILRTLLHDEPLAAQTMFYFKPPQARGQALHQDNFYLKVQPYSCIAAWLAIDPSTPENGGLYVVPGTHKLDVLCPEPANSAESFTTHLVRPPGGQQPVPAILEPGDMLFFNGSVIHGSTPNNSKTQWRRSFISHYTPAAASHISEWYAPLLGFDGQVVERDKTTTGGPCGNEWVNFSSYGRD
jgi:ectoine hydroxylase-related dioxygenase (phytanoyl-CoA dioxygenase family)